MSVHADPLRNTLDHLALDPKAASDRKYLVSMLRRLGYSDAEIRRTLQVDEGEDDHVIEIEYMGKGRQETQFEVVGSDDEPEHEFTLEEPEETFEPAEEPWVDEVEEDPVEFQEIPVEPEPEEELVEFVERPPEPEESFPDEEQEPDLIGFTATRGSLQDARVDEDYDPALAAGWKPVDGYDRPRTPPGEGEWEVMEDDHVDATTWEADEDDGATQETWEPEEGPGLDQDTWEPEENPGLGQDTWEPAEDDEPADASSTWEPVESDAEPELETEWDSEQEGWEPEQPEWSDDGVFRYEDYTLYTRDVELSTGRQQQIYFFAKSAPKSGEPAAMPDGYVVEVNEKTGLPFLRRGDKAAGEPTAPLQEKQKETERAARCDAITAAGSRCQNSAREGSSYCGSHKGYRPQAASESTDTKPRGKKTKDTAPKPRGKKTKDTAPKASKLDPDRCLAVTAAGTQCKRRHRENSRFCGLHKSWRGEKVA